MLGESPVVLSCTSFSPFPVPFRPRPSAIEAPPPYRFLGTPGLQILEGISSRSRLIALLYRDFLGMLGESPVVLSCTSFSPLPVPFSPSPSAIEALLWIFLLPWASRFC